MNRSLLKILIITLLVFTTAACSSSSQESKDTSTPSIKESTVSLIPQATTVIPSLTSSPSPTTTSTRTPSPTQTPTLTPTPTPQWMDASLVLSDFQDGFREMNEQELSLIKHNLPRDSIVFGFSKDSDAQVVMGYLVSYPTYVEQIAFDSSLPGMLDLFATTYGATTPPKSIPGMKGLGETQAASTFVAGGGEIDLRWDTFIFRRGEIGAFLFVVYPNGKALATQSADLAYLLDERLIQALPPRMILRVNYGNDTIESYYEAGHAVTITVVEREKATVKATAQTMTSALSFQDGKPGFLTTKDIWSPGQPDLQPYDWVFVQVDNGVAAWVEIGDIRGEVRFDLDRITGVIEAPWITTPLPVECMDWSSSGEPYSNKDGGAILATGASSYTCSWIGEWDVQPWQDIGVAYTTPEGHWVANAFRDQRWMAMWTFDPPSDFLEEGAYSYYFKSSFTVPQLSSSFSAPVRMTVVNSRNDVETPLYKGYVLVGPWSGMPQQAWTSSGCEVISTINSNQPIRFIWGWVNDYSMTEEQALAHFQSFSVQVIWHGKPVDLEMGDLLPFKNRDSRMEYLCSFTEHP